MCFEERHVSGNGATPAHFAAADGHLGVLRVLQKGGEEAQRGKNRFGKGAEEVAKEDGVIFYNMVSNVFVYLSSKVCLNLPKDASSFCDPRFNPRTCQHWTMQEELSRIMLPHRSGVSYDLIMPKGFLCEKETLGVR